MEALSWQWSWALGKNWITSLEMFVWVQLYLFYMYVEIFVVLNVKFFQS